MERGKSMEEKNNDKLLSPEELLGFLDEPNSNEDFTLDLENAREERAEVILSKYTNERQS